MRISKNKNQLLILFLVAGFFIGILYQNFMAKDMLSSVFEKSTLQYFKQTEIVKGKYFWYVLRERVECLAIICLLGCIRWKKVLVGGILGIVGFFNGVLMVSAVLQLGIKGILLCLVGMLPQGIFYVFAYGLLLWHWYRFPSSKWNKAKTIFVFITLGVGILLETYVNPWLVKWMIGMI